MVYIVAVLGFDERHVIRSILRIGFSNVLGVYLIIPAGEESSQAEKTERAIKEIEKVARLAGVSKIEIVNIDPLNIEESIMRLRSLIENLVAGGGRVIISLGGGMRSLIIETLLASVILPKELQDNVRIVSDLESGRGYIDFVLADIISINELTGELMKLISYIADKGRTSLANISRDLDIPKTTAWKMLKKLTALGFVERVDKRSYKLSQRGERIHKLVKYYYT